ncbi:translation initiation factor Sui1 [candidate division MSBL1 archaeon SCGC-AAA382C18]|uniref:Protein translation factor SUI1 homolog n=1 Tax=candidate division MSBL1 archaeon SCGC-AAA382C18 TaxID=1698281 RepID=A0A133VKW5_9EURY|nr:translation initiation factor Sui1 [candidate division MSBL1 archaeon SCGC-AAA382C18]
MPEICPICGLPEEICTCEGIAHEQENVRVFLEGRSYGKTVTVIDGLDSGVRSLEEQASELKKSFGCGGTVKDGHIELQGNHRERVKKTLADKGIPAQDMEIR